MRSKATHAQCQVTISDCEKVDMSCVPVLAILGSTGCGKSRLAIELACKFFGEIISADSMQVYKGLDIVTAKVTKEEQAKAAHHMLDIVDPLNPSYTVVQFRDAAIPIINDLLARRKLPIIVGGTNYYIESILWEVLMNDSRIGKDDDDRLDENVSRTKRMKIELDRSMTKDNQELYEELVKVDPEMAKRFHPNNRRKIIRSLEVFEQHGVKHSELLKAQRIAGGSGLGGPLRYRNAILLWINCDMKVLEDRLERRVDDMVETGLVQELLDFHRRYNKQRIKSNTSCNLFHGVSFLTYVARNISASSMSRIMQMLLFTATACSASAGYDVRPWNIKVSEGRSVDYTKGIFQSIGFKEFHDYLVLPEEEKGGKKGQELLQRGIDDLKMVTKRYAKKQKKWVMNRLLRRSDRQVPPIYVLDSTDVNQWDSCVYEPAVAIIEAVLRGEKPEQKPLNESIENKKFSDSSNEERHFCDICDRIFIGEFQWNIHLKSTKHKRIEKRKKKLEAQN